MQASVPTHLAPGLSQCAETYMAPCQLGSPGVCGGPNGCARDNLLGDFCLKPQPCPSAAAVNGGFATLPGLVGGHQAHRAGGHCTPHSPDWPRCLPVGAQEKPLAHWHCDPHTDPGCIVVGKTTKDVPAGLALNSTVFGPIPASSVHQPLPYPKGYAGLTNTCGCAASNFSVCHIPSSNPAVVAAHPSTPCSLKIYGDLY